MDNQPLLDELLDLLHTINRINRGLVLKERHGHPVNLSHIQMHAMITIRRHGVLNMSELADHLLVTRPQLTKIINALEEMDLIVRKGNPESRREVLIQLTGRGESYLEDGLLGKSGLLNQVLAAASDEDIAEMCQALGTLRRIFAKVHID